jgi:hypothetical protein
MDYCIDPSFPAVKQVVVPMDDVKKAQYYTLADMQGGDQAGTTETDSKTAPKSGGYSTINSK